MEAFLPAAAEIKVVYKTDQKHTDRMQVSTSASAHRILLQAFDQDTIALQEQFVVLYLNQANHVLGIYRLGIGGITSVVADPRMIISVGLNIAAINIIVAHNHPSGNLKPSQADEQLTTKLKEASRFFDMKLLDHLIVSPCGEEYLSFADEGIV